MRKVKLINGSRECGWLYARAQIVEFLSLEDSPQLCLAINTYVIDNRFRYLGGFDATSNTISNIHSELVENNKNARR